MPIVSPEYIRDAHYDLIETRLRDISTLFTPVIAKSPDSVLAVLSPIIVTLGLLESTKHITGTDWAALYVTYILPMYTAIATTLKNK